MIDWQYYPKSDRVPHHLQRLINVFEAHHDTIGSVANDLASNQVLAHVRDGLVEIGFEVEASKSFEGKLQVPVLFGKNGKLEKSFEADAFDRNTGTVLEVEAGRAVVNNAFLKDLFEACMMQDAVYLAIAVRKTYKTVADFSKVSSFFDTLYASRRLVLPLKGILILGY